MTAPLLVEIGCEEIPAKVIAEAAEDLARRIVGILDGAGLAHGPVGAWGGSRRLAVQVRDVALRQADREEEVLGPPARAAFDAGGALTAAALGFARRQGIDPGGLVRIVTAKGAYVGHRRAVAGRTAGEILGEMLPGAVAQMSFPKSMRWGEGAFRWVRPVHWVLALHGEAVLSVEIFGVRSGGASRGHRFLAPGPVAVRSPGEYGEALRGAFVIADPEERRRVLLGRLEEAAASVGGDLVADDALLDEVANLVEWPGVAVGRFEERFLDLPREILVATLRHHQKSFSVQSGVGLLPAFLAVSNTDRDPAGHIRRGNEWVVGGRLEDARFFWEEDRRVPLADRVPKLGGIVFHKAVGSYGDQLEEIRRVAADLARRIDASPDCTAAALRAAGLAKADLLTGLVGEFPEMQGIVGGLLLRAEGAGDDVALAVYEHYRPAGAGDALPGSEAGCIVSVADRLAAVGKLVPAGEAPTGSRDPFGLRRALNGVFRIVEERAWPLGLADLFELAGSHETTIAFLRDRFVNSLRDRGYTLNEILAVMRPRVGSDEHTRWPLADVSARLEAIKEVRGRADFEHLVDMTKRVDNIQTKGGEIVERASGDARGEGTYREEEAAAIALERLVAESAAPMADAAQRRAYGETVEIIARFVQPVERFFAEVLVLDPERPAATLFRLGLLSRTRALLTSCFDIRELAGQADRRG